MEDRDFDVFVAGGGDDFANVVRLDRQLAVAPIDHHGQSDGFRAAIIDDRVHGGADRAARIDHIVHEHQGFAVEVGGDVGFAGSAGTDAVKVVAVEGDVDRPHGDGDAFELLDLLGEDMGDRDASGLDAEKHELGQVVGAFDDLGGEAGKGAPDFLVGEDNDRGGLGHGLGGGDGAGLKLQ